MGLGGVGAILSQLYVLVCPHTAASRLKSVKALHNSLLLLQIKVQSLKSGWTLESWGQKRGVIQFTKWKFFLFTWHLVLIPYLDLFENLWRSKSLCDTTSWTIQLHNSVITLFRKPFQTFCSVHQIIKYMLGAKNTVISCFHPTEKQVHLSWAHLIFCPSSKTNVSSSPTGLSSSRTELWLICLGSLTSCLAQNRNCSLLTCSECLILCLYFWTKEGIMIFLKNHFIEVWLMYEKMYITWWV